MKFNKIFLSAIACSLALASCDDQVMEWKTPEGHNPISSSEIPLSLAEKIANYNYIKAYAQQYTPNMTIGLGLGATNYIEDEAYRTVADANFQVYTTGNAMKHSSVVKNNGDLDFTQIDNYLALVPQDVQIYGHNFLWHTQQRQAYLKSLIAPEIKVETSNDDVCENVISNYDFETNLTGWKSWSHHTKEIATPGYESNGALKLTVDNTSSNNWDDQLFWVCDNILEVGTTYAFQFWAKTETPGAKVQFIAQADPSGSPQDWGATFELSNDWIQYTGEYTVPEAKEGLQRIGLQFGGMEAVIYIDDFKFGKKIEKPIDPDEGRINLLVNGKFDADASNWAKYNGPDDCKTWNGEEGNFTEGCMQVVNPYDETGNQWKVQIHADLIDKIPSGTKFYVSYYIKCANGTGSVRCSTTGNAHYQGDKTVTPAWTRIEWEVTAGGDIEGLNFDMAAVANTYYIDDVVVSTDPFVLEQPTARAASRAAITYIYKTPEEKKEILLNAMETWIKGIAEHVEEKAPGRVIAWDVINEPIDDNCKWRGIDGNFSSDDAEPVEENGLSLNWADDHWYWGYYIGKEYAVKAFEYARKYCAAGTKLFVNDYNLETNPSKLAALIEFVEYIETGGQQVDGIGTQMHVSTSITKAQVDAMFQTMAATGKLVRVTELDVQVGTTTPSAEQLETQANTYQMIIESYKANIPTNQQSGITIWTLSDNAAEHEYWLPEDAPNLFDSNYARKHAYKGVCDGLAGYDVSTDFSGDDWKNAQ